MSCLHQDATQCEVSLAMPEGELRLVVWACYRCGGRGLEDRQQ